MIVGASKVVRDITEHERQEHALREANAALAQSNDDLQYFAYAASHDLHEPLRTVRLYSEMLKRELSGKLGPLGELYIARAIGGACHMEQLLKDLQTYVMASTASPEPTEEVDAGEILDQVLLSLESALKESAAFISRTTLPRVRMHFFQLEQLFQNLIGNAILYRSSERPRIRVAAERQINEWVFSVQDNGIGIDAQDKDQIFGVFKRLQGSDAYRGTGLGLAICKRIVERAGGRIWVDSEIGRGSTFHFTIPAGGPILVTTARGTDTTRGQFTVE